MPMIEGALHETDHEDAHSCDKQCHWFDRHDHSDAEIDLGAIFESTAISALSIT
jgi:hypothetical protein